MESPKKNLPLFLKKCVEKMNDKQQLFMEQYDFGKKHNKFIFFPNKNKFFMFNDKTKKVFLEARFQVIGTYSEVSNTWRWAWSNRFIPHNLRKTAIKLQEFGEINKIDLFTQPKIKDDNMGYIFTAVGMELSKGKGFYIIPAHKEFPDLFIIFTKANKINKTYNSIINQNMKIDEKKTKHMKKYLDLTNNVVGTKISKKKLK